VALTLLLLHKATTESPSTVRDVFLYDAIAIFCRFLMSMATSGNSVLLPFTATTTNSTKLCDKAVGLDGKLNAMFIFGKKVYCKDLFQGFSQDSNELVAR